MKRNANTYGCPTRHWLADDLGSEADLALKRLSRLADVQRLCVMPDVHFAEPTCVGTVLATQTLVYPFVIGSDIGCGMLSAPFNCMADEVVSVDSAAAIFRMLSSQVPVKRHPHRDDVKAFLDVIVPEGLSTSHLRSHAERAGLIEFGTLGRGNHFVEFQSDDAGQMWVTIHTGSRTMGPRVQSSLDSKTSAGLDSGTVEGQAWLSDMEWCRNYARLNRLKILDAVIQGLDDLFGVTCDRAGIIDCDHDHVQRERHDGVDLWVHRKGANFLPAGKTVIIAGSMGTPSYHVVARKSDESMHSCSHGAGRVLTRSQAQRQIADTQFEADTRQIFLTPAPISRLKEEAPSAYRDISKVLRAQKALLKRIRKLTPLLSFKGG